ncbi:hypothetical protein [Breoghania sp.]|uniref:hypothetical protein n=1 Tax=Breoghania sp. TaxID=2065378 RepID=UPI002AAA6957|nr:hypothetical protein [Breoghania sp.]
MRLPSAFYVMAVMYADLAQSWRLVSLPVAIVSTISVAVLADALREPRATDVAQASTSIAKTDRARIAAAGCS